MSPSSSRAQSDDRDFDLDVRLEPVIRNGAEAAPGTPPPNTVSCKECGTQYSCVGCFA